MYSRTGLLSLVFIIIVGVLFISFGVLRAAKKSEQAEVGIGTMHAWLDNEKTITLKLSTPEPNKKEALKNIFKVVDAENKELEIASVAPMLVEGKNTGLLEVQLSEPLKVDKLYFMKAANYNKAPIIPRHVLDNKEYFYAGNDLGGVYSPKETAFRIWAPTAISINVMLYDYYNSDLTNTFTKQSLSKDVNGTWKANVEGDLNGNYYIYEINLYVDGKATTYQVVDPYSRASAVNCSKTLIFNPEDINKGVPGWDVDTYVSLKQSVDAVIYEVHVRDFTISPTSGVKPDYKGRYLGLTQHNTESAEKLSTGLDDIEELGVTHVHLLPTYDYGTGDEAEMNSSYTWYNWGYDPVLYNNIEGSYSTYPNGITRQIEYKKMVQAFHGSKLGVVFDVVFNHTFQTGDKKLSIFDKVVPYYYYRVKNDGTYSDGSFCGNEVATERPMVRKFIVDSMKYFAKEYHIDGFRFDLMGLMDKQTMLDVYKEVRKINPNAIIYGEGWKMPTILPVEECMTQVNVKDSGIAAFNDGIRDNLKGDVFKEKSKGFVQNAVPMTGIKRLKAQIKGQDTGRDKDPILVASPNAAVNYVSCHDNLCLWDKLVVADPKASTETIKKMDLLAFGAVITSQGIPFFAEGDDFGRTKNGAENSYDNNDPTVNPINWTLKSKNKDMYKFYQGMIKLRKTHPAFRMYTKEMVDQHLRFIDKTPDSLIAYVLKDNANGDTWKNILVVLNSSPDDQVIELVGEWNIVVLGDKAGTEMIKIDTDKITIPGISILVAHTESKIFPIEL